MITQKYILQTKLRSKKIIYTSGSQPVVRVPPAPGVHEKPQGVRQSKNT